MKSLLQQPALLHPLRLCLQPSSGDRFGCAWFLTKDTHECMRSGIAVVPSLCYAALLRISMTSDGWLCLAEAGRHVARPAASGSRHHTLALPRAMFPAQGPTSGFTCCLQELVECSRMMRDDQTTLQVLVLARARHSQLGLNKRGSRLMKGANHHR